MNSRKADKKADQKNRSAEEGVLEGVLLHRTYASLIMGGVLGRVGGASRQTSHHGWSVEVTTVCEKPLESLIRLID